MACGEEVEARCQGLGSELALVLCDLRRALSAAVSSGAPAGYQGVDKRRKVCAKHCGEVASAQWFDGRGL